jgi:hypothetical protein
MERAGRLEPRRRSRVSPWRLDHRQQVSVCTPKLLMLHPAAVRLPRHHQAYLDPTTRLVIKTIKVAWRGEMAGRGPNPLRVWWCSTGPLASLPLHAAGGRDPPRGRVRLLGQPEGSRGRQLLGCQGVGLPARLLPRRRPRWPGPAVRRPLGLRHPRRRSRGHPRHNPRRGPLPRRPARRDARRVEQDHLHRADDDEP